ncbi:hypothetical protein HMPREF1210_01445 [Paenisporosarcina sp. HGH0030]|nr:hypothetical protein HMPREF1210_01445 [Paenisporosarcina sp. HGH0030]
MKYAKAEVLVTPLKGAIVEQHRQKMIKFFYKTKLKSSDKESILINLFSKWILLVRKIWVFAVLFNQTLFQSNKKTFSEDN